MFVELVLFGILAVIAVISAAAMLISRNAVYSVVFLVLNFAVVAVFYLLLGAPFIAMVQITVYAGAIMVLFMFVVMLLGAEQLQSHVQPSPVYRTLAIVLITALVGTAIFGLISAQVPTTAAAVANPEAFGGPEEIGFSLFTDYLFPFQTVAFLLLVAMIGAVVLTRDDKEKVDVRITRRRDRTRLNQDILQRQLKAASAHQAATHTNGVNGSHTPAEAIPPIVPEPMPEPEPTPEPAAIATAATPTTPAPAAPTGVPDKLTKLEGVGPKSEKALHAAGYTTFAAVAAATPDQLRTALDAAGLPAIVDPTTWPEQAALAARGDWDAFQKLTDSLRGGRRTEN